MQSYSVVGIGDGKEDLRDSDAGCYDFCIERTNDEERLNESKRSNGGDSNE
jgi:hypothetical protein